MKRIGIFYGSTTGVTDVLAFQIAEKLNIPKTDVHDVAKIKSIAISVYDVLLFGTSTWGKREMQDDWYKAAPIFKASGLKGKDIALFGCGNSVLYKETFCNGLKVLYNELKDSECKFHGFVDASEYSFGHSSAVIDGKFIGLPIDDANEGERTEKRIEKWIAILKQEINF